MSLHDLVLGLLSGLVALVLGLIPGLLDELTQAARRVRDQLITGVPSRPLGHWEGVRPRRHRGLIAFGGAWMLLSLLAYLLA